VNYGYNAGNESIPCPECFWSNSSIGFWRYEIQNIVEAEDITLPAGWSRYGTGIVYSGGEVILSNTAGSSVQATNLIGRYFTLTYWSGPNRGVAVVNINGVNYNVNMYSADYEPSARCFSVDLQNIKQSAITVSVPQPSSGYVVIDRFQASSTPTCP
jgi:hypothetical protein